MMKRCAFLLVLLLGIGLLQPVRALASVTTVTCEVTKLGDDTTYSGTEDVGMEDCENAALTFVVRGQVGTQYQKYVGSNCSKDSKEDCEPIETEEEIGSLGEDEFEISVKDLLGHYNETCEGTTKTVRIYIFPEDQTTGGVECTSITVDTAGPAAPTNVKGKPGENEINISWDVNDDDDDETYEYEVVYKIVDDCEALLEDIDDALASADDSQTYESDAAVDADAGTVDTNDVDPVLKDLWDIDGSETAQGDDHTLKGVAEPGEELMITVAAIDEAGNRSLPSWPPICVRVVETYGFCDSTDSCEDGCSVGSIGRTRAQTRAGVVIGLLTLFTLVWVRRRSRT